MAETTKNETIQTNESSDSVIMSIIFKSILTIAVSAGILYLIGI